MVTAMLRRHILISAIIGAIAVVFFGVWALMYPSPDPKNIKYVLWKAEPLQTEP